MPVSPIFCFAASTKYVYLLSMTELVRRVASFDFQVLLVAAQSERS